MASEYPSTCNCPVCGEQIFKRGEDWSRWFKHLEKCLPFIIQALEFGGHSIDHCCGIYFGDAIALDKHWREAPHDWTKIAVMRVMEGF